MSAAHWSVLSRRDSIEIVDEDWKAVCELWRRGSPQQEMHFARLMAAAPKLLAALQAIVKSLADHDDEGMIEHAEEMIEARAAIAAAVGETK